MTAELRRCVPEDAVWIVQQLEDAGFETWVVGGAVRDAAAGTPVDWDFTTRAKPRDMRRVFRRTVPLGIDHGTVGVIAPSGRMYEVTTFRKDVETTGRHAVVRFAERVEDDLSRRDFSFNAMAWHPIEHTLLDPHGGLVDLSARVLRTVGEPRERFAEDYLRILRALRFAGRLALTIEPRTWEALSAAVSNLRHLSGERVREEILKVLSAREPSNALSLYRSSGALRVILPELDHPQFEFQRILRTVDSVRPHRLIARLAVLMSAGGRGAPEVSRVADRMRELRFSNDEVAAVAELNGVPALPGADQSDAEVRRWLSRFGGERLNDLLRIRIAEVRATVSSAGSLEARQEGAGYSVQLRACLERISRVRSVLRTRPPLSIGDLAIDGNDLKRMGMRPGPHFKQLLGTLLEEVLVDPGLNQRAHLESRVRELIEESES